MEFVVIYNLDVKQKVPEKYSKIFLEWDVFGVLRESFGN